MVDRSRERAIREKLAERVTFKMADAQELPFDDATFDAVMTESVTSFPADKLKAVREYARVTKPGGYTIPAGGLRATMAVALAEGWTRLAAPNVLAMVVMAAMSIAEGAFAGALGMDALAGLALVFPFVMLVQMLSAGSFGGAISAVLINIPGTPDAVPTMIEGHQLAQRGGV